MSIEKPYQPSPEEIKKAQEMADVIQNERGEEMMTKEEINASEKRERIFKAGEEKGKEKREQQELLKNVLKWIEGLNVVELAKEASISLGQGWSGMAREVFILSKIVQEESNHGYIIDDIGNSQIWKDFIEKCKLEDLECSIHLFRASVSGAIDVGGERDTYNSIAISAEFTRDKKGRLLK